MATDDTKTSNTPSPVLVEDANGTPLVEANFATFSVIEDVQTEPGKPKKVKVRGEFARCDEATANKRVYPKQLWEREIKRLKESFDSRKVFGELDHPNDGRTMLNRVSHIVTNMTIEDGRVIGEAEILDTDAGRNLQALLKAKCKVGVSSRGYGSTKPNTKGEDVVQEDYKLATFDFVADPADGTAYPEVFFENKGKMMDVKTLTADVLKTENPALAESLVTEAAAKKDAEWQTRLDVERAEAASAAKMSMKDEFARELMVAVTKAKAEVTESVRTELMADPMIAGAKNTLDAVRAVLQPYILPEDVQAHVASIEKDFTAKLENASLSLAERDLQIKELSDRVAELTDLNSKLEGVAKEVGYSLFLERILAGASDAEVIRKMVGDVKQYNASDEIKQKVEAIRSELAAQAEKAAVAAREAQKKSEQSNKESAAVMKQAESKMTELHKALEESLKAQEQMGLQLYAHQRLTNHPKAAKIRHMIESSNASSTDEIDNIIEGFREPNRDSEDLEQVRARVRKMSRSGTEHRALDEEEEAPSRRKSALSEDKLGIGISAEEFRSLSGLRTKK